MCSSLSSFSTARPPKGGVFSSMGISVAVPSAALILLLLSLILPPATAHFSFTYNFSATSDSAPSGISFQGDAFFNKFIRLTRDERVGPLTSSAGRAYFSRPIPLSDPVSRRPASFASAFSFAISAPEPSAASGDGLAFFLSPFPSVLPNSSAGGLLGLFNSSARDGAGALPLVAIEFDTYRNDWDPSDDHVGINLGGIVSAATADWPTSMKDGRTAHARVAYDGQTKNLTVALSYDGDAAAPTDVILWYAVDLREYLTNAVAVGFSAATGEAAELHKVMYWDFTSTIDPKEETVILWVVLGVCGFLVLLVAAGVVWFAKEWRKAGESVLYADIEDAMGYEELDDDEFLVESGPRRFGYAELAAATKNFSEERKLGQGGFGAVYRGFLKELGLEVAIKRVSKGSTQGRKEYAAEVRIISQLRHRHLVQLVGWCHEHRGDFLLVYELMPNGSVDQHLYGKGVPLTWPTRYDIALGLASALLYLHEECLQCIVHRDIKPSNVMLDATFNAKLGDFGLAKLVEHGSDPYTTVLAGTLGYLAPECLTTGKASQESDVYSFGVVALEIACGRRPAELSMEPSKARLVPWVWELHGKKALLEAADSRLEGVFDEKQMEHLMVVGLWCAHPDYTNRPSIRQALNVLKFEAPLPVLAQKMPVPTFFPIHLPEVSVGGVSRGCLRMITDIQKCEPSADSGPSATDKLL